MSAVKRGKRRCGDPSTAKQILTVIGVIDGSRLPRSNAELWLLQPNDDTAISHGFDHGRHRRCRIAKPRKNSMTRQWRAITRHPACLTEMHLFTGERRLRTNNNLMRCRINADNIERPLSLVSVLSGWVRSGDPERQTDSLPRRGN